MKNKRTRVRSAATGEFVPSAEAVTDPGGTVVETVAPPEDRFWIALLDEDGTLTGFDRSGIPCPGIEVPVGCDLKPGKYRWDMVWQTFVPLDPVIGRRAGGPRLTPPVDGRSAIAAGLAALFEDTGCPMPVETQRYLDWFAKQPRRR